MVYSIVPKICPMGHMLPIKDILLAHQVILRPPVLLSSKLVPVHSAYVWGVMCAWLFSSTPLCLSAPLSLRQGTSNYGLQKAGPHFPLKYW